MKLHYKDGYKYQVWEEYRFKPPKGYSNYIMENLNTDIKFKFLAWDEQNIVILPGYAWDGASSVAKDTKSNMRGSLVHDVLYQLIRNKLLPQSYRKTADEYMLEICKEDGMNWFRRWYYLKALRKGAGFAANPKNKKKVKTVGK